MTEVYKYIFTEEDLKNLSSTKYVDSDKKFLKIIEEVRNTDYYYKKYHLPKYTDLTITKHEKITIIPKNYKDHYECRNYSFVYNKESMCNFDKCLPLFYGNGGFFQHFLMHIYPVLVFIKNFLIDNPDIIIAMYPINKDFDSFEYLIKKLKIKNKFYFIEKNINVFNAYMVNINPFQNYTYLPPNMIRKTHEQLFEEHDIKNFLIYMGRKNMKTRVDENHEEVCNFLKDYANRNNLKFIDFEHQNYSIEERFKLFRQANIVVYIHGGAGYNIYFCPKETKIIEFNFCASCKELKVDEDPRKPRKNELFDTLEYIANPIGFDFYGIVIEKASKYCKNVRINVDKIKEILT